MDIVFIVMIGAFLVAGISGIGLIVELHKDHKNWRKTILSSLIFGVILALMVGGYLLAPLIDKGII